MDSTLAESLNSRGIGIQGHCTDLAQSLLQVQEWDQIWDLYLETRIHLLPNLSRMDFPGDSDSL